MKSVTAIHNPPPMHWVGDGFPVRSLFSYDRMGARNVSPFLLLDYAAPREFSPAKAPRGVGSHPHRGFETVTIVYDGELEHRDSTGAGGLIGPGDVQWMTAGAGIVHEEFHSRAFTASGGTASMAQLWVNLPAEHKSAPANYQTLLNQDIPRVSLNEGGGLVRVIAGSYMGHQGPARTYTPINIWDVQLEAGSENTLSVPDGHTLMIAVLKGAVSVNQTETVHEAGLIRFDREGEAFCLQATEPARLLLMSGQPIDEPVVGYGPFVMNAEAEIRQAIRDFNEGKFNDLPAVAEL